MIVDQKYPRSRQELLGALATALSASRTVVVQTGHFVLYQEGAGTPAIPCVASEINDPRLDWIKDELGHFPHLSWSLATTLLASLPGLRTYYLVLVNDWQYVPDADARSNFYRDFQRLPSSYAPPLAPSGPSNTLLTPKGIETFTCPAPFFSERSLRNQFHRRLKKLVQAGQLPADSEISENDTGATSAIVEVLGQRREVYCSSKRADCSGEVAQMIDEAYAHVACDTFINLVPRVCEHFVELGSELSSTVLKTGVSTVINIFLPATRVLTEQDLLSEATVTVHGFPPNAAG